MKRIDDKNSLTMVLRFVFFMMAGLLASFVSFPQCVSFKLTDRGDTINCMDTKGRKQGPWLEKYPELRGNPGYEEEGEYLDNRKNGIWRRYSQQGDIMAVETYKWGFLHGKCFYYSVMGLEREEGWWAIDPDKKFDTLDVPDLMNEGTYKTVIVANEGRSLRHGTWNFYNPMTGRIERSEEFIRDSAVTVLGSLGIQTSKSRTGTPAPDSTGKKVEKPAVVQEWEKKNSGKKKVKVRDGSTGF